MIDLIVLFIPLIISTTFAQNGDGPLPIESIRAQKCRSYIRQPSNEALTLAEEYPHVAQIAYNRHNTSEWQCQGSLISSRYILTAAQCVISGFYGPPIKVRLGVLSSHPIEHNIENCHAHPNYTDHHLYDDIGLIKTSATIVFTEFIRPICLPDSDITANLYYRLNYRFQRIAPDYVPILEWHQLEPIDNDLCTQYFRSIVSAKKMRDGFRDTQICLREMIYTVGACGGYSGAPLLVPHPESQFINILIGVTMYGRRCNYRNPEGYTRVYRYVEWVENMVWVHSGVSNTI